MRITTWNINGIRSLHDEKSDKLLEIFNKLNSDIICIQETKISKNQVTEKLAFLNSNYDSYWSFSTVKKGYRLKIYFISFSGVATFVKKNSKSVKVISAWKNLNDEEIDQEGRCLITDHGNFVLFNL
jgi:exonuclease III